jgi:SAM-dependent methyltransferase
VRRERIAGRWAIGRVATSSVGSHPDRDRRVAGWVRDTRIGARLITSDLWAWYVVRTALADLVRLLGAPGRYATILDVGCGGGKAFDLLADTFHPELLLGLDPDPEMLECASRAAASCRCRVDVRPGCATPLELPDRSADMIFCHQTLHHVPDPEQAAREFHRVLRPGGVLLLSESCAPFIRSVRVRLLFRHPMDAQRTADEYLALLRSAGFAFTGDNVSTPYPWWSRWDVGALEWFGMRVPTQRRETVLNVAAFRGA